MKQVKEMPTSGQFVAVWMILGKPTSKLYRACDGLVSLYDEDASQWSELEDQETVDQSFIDLNAKFFVL